jgi:hypothetical protein
MGEVASLWASSVAEVRVAQTFLAFLHKYI